MEGSVGKSVVRSKPIIHLKNYSKIYNLMIHIYFFQKSPGSGCMVANNDRIYDNNLFYQKSNI